jgi:hypothetical protein
MTAIQSTLSSDQDFKVLTPSLREKLRAAAYATRVLAKSGYRVVRQDLRINTTRRPVLTVCNGNEQLLDDLTQIAREPTPEGMVVIGRFLDVDLRLTPN